MKNALFFLRKFVRSLNITLPVLKLFLQKYSSEIIQVIIAYELVDLENKSYTNNRILCDAYQ